MLVTVLLGSIVFTSCNSDNEDGGSVDNATSMIVGTWYCIYQEWDEDGDINSSTYEPSSRCCIQLKENKTGNMYGGPDELFEIGGTHKNFSWFVQKKKGSNYLFTDVYDGEEYKINKLNATTLEMTWEDVFEQDHYYRIFCRFVRAEE